MPREQSAAFTPIPMLMSSANYKAASAGVTFRKTLQPVSARLVGFFRIGDEREGSRSERRKSGGVGDGADHPGHLDVDL